MTLVVVRKVAELRRLVRRLRNAGDAVALVPTMGAIHDGHLALVRAGQRLRARTIVTIFVNPRQFGPAEDFAAYPSDEAGDLAKLAGAGADAVFIPAIEEMYPSDFCTTVSVAGLTDGLCAPLRPGHFDGVATVVAKLLIQSLPDVALFGEKDYQQLQVIKRLARDLDLPTRIVGVPTVREPDGLALSSRNAYLSTQERSAAPALYRTLCSLAQRLSGGAAAGPLLAQAHAELAQFGFGPLHYLVLCDAQTLAPLERVDRPARLLASMFFGITRLIDNIAVGPGAASMRAAVPTSVSQ